MAKQIGVVQISGALGEVVGAKKSAGQKHNIIRVRAYEPKNPRTEDQMIQRLKAKAATNIYSALKGILNHSFQGLGYGAPCRNFFMQQAMLMEDGTFPWLKRNVTMPVPGEYLVSKGSLPGVPISLGTGKIELSDNSAINIATEADLANYFKVAFGLNVGQQITIIAISKIGTLFQVEYEEHVLSNSTESLDVEYFEFLNEEDTMYINSINHPDSIVAAAIIVSQPVVATNSDVVNWERSTTYLQFSSADTEVAKYYGNEAKAAAIASFKKATTDPKSDWYLNQGKLS